jgi:hypothetical protein
MKNSNEVIASHAASTGMNSFGYLQLNLSEFSDIELIELMMILARKKRNKIDADAVDFDSLDFNTFDEHDFLTVDEYLEEKYGC